NLHPQGTARATATRDQPPKPESVRGEVVQNRPRTEGDGLVRAPQQMRARVAERQADECAPGVRVLVGCPVPLEVVEHEQPLGPRWHAADLGLQRGEGPRTT